MCGPFVYLRKKRVHSDAEVYGAFMKIRHRGPDSHVFESHGDVDIGFQRLAIIDPTVCGDQPFSYIEDGEKVIVVCNGEIYNHKQLTEQFGFDVKSQCDCEVLVHLYKNCQSLEKMLPFLEGSEFAIIVVRISKDRISIEYARDPAGTRPLYFGEDENGLILCSELKGCMISPQNGITEGEIKQIEPRSVFTTVFDKKTKQTQHSSKVYWETPKTYTITDWDEAKKALREALTEAVRCRLESDRGMVFLNSGGLDSSIVSALGQKMSRKPIKTLCVGMEGATDERYAKILAEHIGSDHTHIRSEEQEFLDIYKDVPYIVESWDVTTNRASTVQLRAGMAVKQQGDDCVVMVGEGADELLGGYLYFHNCPEDMFGEETRSRFERIHEYDGQRADRCLSYNSLECRTPFLDSRVVRTILSIDPKLRMPKDGVEKALMREAFADLLPKEVVERQKEAQSDGCSSTERSWFDIIKEKYPDEDGFCLERFDSEFGKERRTAVPEKWLPRFCGDITDPSARVLKDYRQT